MVKKAKKGLVNYFWSLTRISLGAIFLWAFLDKLFGLGYATCNVAGVTTVGCSSAWVAGGSPTSGFLTHATSGPFADFFSAMAGNGFVDWLFMMGLLGIGLGLIFGIAMKISTVSGVLLVLMMWLSTLWPANNPILDEHIIYAFVLVGLALVNKDQVWGLRKVWLSIPLVKKFAWLE